MPNLKIQNKKNKNKNLKAKQNKHGVTAEKYKTLVQCQPCSPRKKIINYDFILS